MNLLVNRDGQQLGPFTLEDARTALQNGTLQATDLAWMDGMPAWAPLSTVLAGIGAAGGPPSLPGARPPQAFASGGPKTSGLAVASLVLGILSFFCGSIITGIPAIICGHMARSRIQRSPGEYGGAGLALGGLITGYISLALVPILAALAIPAFSAAMEKAQEVQFMNNSRVIAVGCAGFANAHAGKYPESLEELVPNYVADARLLTSPLLKPPQAIGFDYPAAGKVNPAPDDVLLVSKWKSRRGTRVVTQVSGAASLQKEDAAGLAPPPR